jgi:DNA-binding beta-propeller fold protein YncE
MTKTLVGLAAALAASAVPAQPFTGITLTPVGQLATGSASEIAAYEATSKNLFVINGDSGGLDLVSIAEPWAPRLVRSIDLSALGAGATSVAVRAGIVAVAIEAEPATAPGKVAFFNAAGILQSAVTVGSLPDMVTFSPDGRWLLVANEGEPDGYCSGGTDPEGSVSVIDLSGGVSGLTQARVRTATFTSFNGAAPAGVRIFGPGATVAKDLEPEYIAIDAASTKAYVTLQENNALAVVDIASATVSALVPLGSKDHSRAENALDASDRDDAIRIVPQPIRGLYQPDGIAAHNFAGATYLFTANEGDARDYDCFSEEERVGDLDLDPSVAATFGSDLDRLRTTSATGDSDGDGDFDTVYSYGARSLSIWTAAGALVWDSGKEIETITAAAVPGHFNSNGPGTDSLDSRSDDKGPEPEGLALGTFRGRTYAFVGLERTGGIVVYDVTDPTRPFFVQYAANRKLDGSPAVGITHDQGPEGVLYISKEDSPTGRALLVVSHEVSGTVTVFSIKPKPLG